ncbi:MAG: Heterodimeric efflux ABC transporter, permease/ATP-binding subunit 2 [Candidatus Bipolaricaulis sibiricus]|uniref:Heterodimeric efflux ABC transporter, permease/ATP-binding subunit 2 n=1 Tax=Bipolaricaulis sibiricus TaxID=2501609 RepID=A0A410FTQ7_BIPS1|nr:MAG: Heterodimeric efflux ABC transporter, permease/ATP-binding subunit 2 [Candidatus Bipolaricaulis sibiricus]
MASEPRGRPQPAGGAPVPRLFGPGPGRGPGMGGARIERARDVRGTLRRLLGYLRPYRGYFAAIFALALVATGLSLVGPFLMGRAIDGAIRGGDPALLLRIVLLMLGTYVAAWGARYAENLILARATQKAMRTLRGDLFAHLQTLPLRFFDARPHGETMSRLTNDMDAINRVLSQNILQLFTGSLTLVGILVMMFALNPLLALGSFVAFPLMLGLVGWVGKRTRSGFREYQKQLGELNGKLEETYSGQRVVLAFAQGESVLGDFDRTNAAVRVAGIRAQSYALLIPPMMGILSNANIAILAGLGGWLTLLGRASVGTIAAFISYSRQFAEPLRMLGDLYNQVQSALAGAERIFATMDTPPDTPDLPDAVRMETVRGHVEFRNVDFSYVPGVPVLREVSLQARPGQTIALVGPTGAGKTTIVNLLTRFYDVDRGEILIDGVDLRRAERASLRRQIGIVLQQTFLFADTVMENIRYGRLDATDDEVIAAATLAHADPFIRKLPDGYGTVLSERGANLSEGQRQLLAIARAVLADPRILVLDEATSSVDTRTEVAIQKALLGLMKGRTSFVIAHRLSTIRNADEVVVIDGGRIVERGTHDALLAARGFYWRLYTSQFRRTPTALRPAGGSAPAV